jgi:hypothetical protein
MNNVTPSPAPVEFKCEGPLENPKA